MSRAVNPSVNSSVPRILYGTAWKQADTDRLVATAIRLGFRGIDTACQPKHYDEAGVGAGVAACLGGELTRADLYLQSKFTPLSGQDPRRIPYDPRASLAVQIEQSCAVSLQNLRTDHLDCLLLHSPLASANLTLAAWQAMESLVTAGTVVRLGISNCYSPHELTALYDQARIKPSVVQNRFYADTGYDREIRAFCREHRIVYQSFWTLTANPQILGHRVLITLADKYQRCPAQILFRFLTQSDVVPLTGTRSEEHMRADLGIFAFQLTQSECESVDALLQRPGRH